MAGLSPFERGILTRLDGIARSLRYLEPKNGPRPEADRPNRDAEWTGPVVPALLDWEIPGIKASGYYTKRGENHVRLVVDIRGEDAKRALELGEFMGDHILVSAIEGEKSD